jgi:hypothetical protein
MIRIALTAVTRKMLLGRLQQASADHAPRQIRRTHALLWLPEGTAVAQVAGRVGAGEQHPEGTRRDWLHAFVQRGAASLA